MRFERCGPALGVAAALFAAAPALAAPHRETVIWVDVCDAAHPGRRIPLPLRRDREIPLAACHAACAFMPERRARR